jgi:hypothetical protein
MRPVTRLLAAAVLLGLVVSGTALAARGDPQRQITTADQARAKAMLLVRPDLPPAFKAKRAGSGSTTGPGGSDVYCKALDESDLTLTGEASSKEFDAQIAFVSSTAQVYETIADASSSWRRGTSAAGWRCLRQVFTQEFKGPGTRMKSVKRLAFPKVAQRTFAFRIVAAAQGVDVYMDFVVLQHSRAHVGLAVGAALTAFPKAEAVRLARLLAGRLAKAMRGA